VLPPLGFTLLRCLSNGEVHSGEALAATVGLTRARVSQLLRDVELAGLRLERLPGRGYRLLDPSPFLERAAILHALRQTRVKPSIEIVDCIDSTNSELSRRAQGGDDVHRKLLAAEWQTAGRGRRGRGWTAVAGGSLTFSLAWRFEQGAGFLAGLPLAAGVALARALDAIGFKGVELKWPNDLVHRHCKLGGILIELSGDALGPSLAVIGVGLNVRLPAFARRDIDQAVTDLGSMSRQQCIDRNVLLASLAGGLAEMLESYERTGFGPLRAEWQSRHAFQGKAVRVVLPDGDVAGGEVVGVDSDGALILNQGGRRLRFVSGEVSLRAP